MFEKYLLGEITRVQLIDWAIKQMELKIKEIFREEEVEF